MFRLLLLLLVGTIYAQESEAADQGDLEETADTDCQEDGSDLTDDLLTSDLSLCHNATLELDKGTGDSDICADKRRCKYHVFRRKRVFWKAQRSCRRHRGNLCSIHSRVANNRLRCLARRRAANQNLVWIGVWKSKNIRQYKDVDRSRMNYTNWGCRQRKRCGTWCTALNVSTGKWISITCTAHLPFVCTY
ncbi:proteoglycan 3-like [Mixophyes fleayi]|uniref:proteoglycan 3-like n=1 Tax=Mixophyes fleayi TaxID=3061075 RepID=UPI003F4DFFBA